MSMLSQSGGNQDEYPTHCDYHGDRSGRFVCSHLLDNDLQGCFSPDSKEESIDAWCAECEGILQREGTWNKAAADFAHFRLVCDLCFRDIKARNQIRILH